MKVVVCTPAGRRQYLEILKQYILPHPLISEWHLWQNCRKESDLKYIYELAASNKKIKILEHDGVDGTNRSVNNFYKYCIEPNTFYIKMDDDIVYIHPEAVARTVSVAVEERGRFLYWSPVVINNAICSAILSARGILQSSQTVSAQASDGTGWKSALFAKRLHAAFLDALESGRVNDLLLDYRISLGAQRYSINCIGFWGDVVSRLGERFCPSDVDDEEWISAILPIKSGLPGRVVGNALISHYSFYTQDSYLNKTSDLLMRYADVAGYKGNVVAEFDGRSFKKHSKIHFVAFKGYAVDYLNNVLGVYTKSQKKKVFVLLGAKDEN